MRFSPVALLGLAAAAVAADISTWNDIVGNVPACMKTCLNKFYTDNGFEDKCGSPDDATVDCLCGIKGTLSEAQDSGEALGSCISNGCDARDLSDASSQLSDFQNRLMSLESQCDEKGKLLLPLLTSDICVCGIVGG